VVVPSWILLHTTPDHFSVQLVSRCDPGDTDQPDSVQLDLCNVRESDPVSTAACVADSEELKLDDPGPPNRFYTSRCLP
jgi:hypothetical protein